MKAPVAATLELAGAMPRTRLADLAALVRPRVAVMMAISGGTYLVVMGHFNAQPPVPRWIEVVGHNIFCCVALYPLGLILFGIGIHIRTRLQFLASAKPKSPMNDNPATPVSSAI